MAMFLLNKTFIECLDKHRRRFFWHGKKQKRGYYMVKWGRVCRSRKKGGLGIKDLRKQNISLLCKWWWKLETQNGLWQDIVRAKYLRNKTVADISARFNDSPCWKALLKVKDSYFAGRQVNLGNGSITRLWEDPILGNPPYRDQFPTLYDLCQQKNCSIKHCVERNFNILFRRRLRGDLLSQWNSMVELVKDIPLTNSDDWISWSLNKNGLFSTKSIYTWLEKGLAGSHNKWIWKTKIPLKIKIFMWQLGQDALLTRENLRKRNWDGSPVCSFCSQLETNNHLFFTCPISKVVWGTLGMSFGARCVPNSFWQTMAWFHSFIPRMKRFYVIFIAAVCWAIWSIRNKVTFEKHIFRSPSEIIFYTISLLLYWTGLQKEVDKGQLAEGAKNLMHSATIVFSAPSAASGNRQMLLINAP
jgi:hypothetical protein